MPLVYRESLPVEAPKGTVLCLHGYPESSYMWRHLLETVADAGWQAVAPDLPGYGDSPYAGSGTWQAPVDAVDAFHREQDLGEVVLVVHDWGGLIGLRWACEHPELVRAMVISNTGFFSDGKWHGMAQALRTPSQGKSWSTLLTARDFGGMLRAVSPNLDDRSIDEYFKAYGSPERRRGQLGSTAPASSPSWRTTTSRRSGRPRLILWGEDDPFAPVAGAHRFAKELPDTELVVVGGAKHFVFDDEPESLLGRGPRVPGAGLMTRRAIASWLMDMDGVLVHEERRDPGADRIHRPRCATGRPLPGVDQQLHLHPARPERAPTRERAGRARGIDLDQRRWRPRGSSTTSAPAARRSSSARPA